MENWENRLDYLEECNDILNMQNRVLAAALKGFLRALPPDIAENAAEQVQAAFEDEMVRLGYENSRFADLFQDAADNFFGEKI